MSCGKQWQRNRFTMNLFGTTHNSIRTFSIVCRWQMLNDSIEFVTRASVECCFDRQSDAPKRDLTVPGRATQLINRNASLFGGDGIHRHSTASQQSIDSQLWLKSCFSILSETFSLRQSVVLYRYRSRSSMNRDSHSNSTKSFKSLAFEIVRFRIVSFRSHVLFHR